MATAASPAPASNFLRNIIEADLAQGKYAARRWAGQPGDAAVHAAAPLDTARIRTRFPPEPNGYLHIGHAKSICLNAGLARDFGGRFHLRFDDTNPEKEEAQYVDSIIDAVQWLGASFKDDTESNLYFASDYFSVMYRAAEALIEAGHAYIEQQSADQMRATRGTLTEPGSNSPWRERPAAESLALFRAMRAGEHGEGTLILRAKIDMASPNINLRDPAIYRIRKAHHHRTADAWCVYPMYTFAHPIEDALERITHSICTLEFEDQRPFYDWVLARLADAGILATPLPHQHEFARLKLTTIVTSKRKLAQLVTEKHVDGWDDPRMPTILGLRRRGYTPEAIQLFCERLGVSKADSWIDYSVLEAALRDDLESKAIRATAVLDPVKLIIDNYPADAGDECHAPLHPQHPEWGNRTFAFARELWIEREDFEEQPQKGFFRLFPGNRVRLRYGFVIECTGCEKDETGRITAIHATYFADSKSGTPGSNIYKVKGNVHWVAVLGAVSAEVRLYDRLFIEAQPDGGGRDFLTTLNPHSRQVITAYLEASLGQALPDQRFQFERHGYFVADRVDSTPGAPVFNRAVTLKDAWQK